jgi:prepilin-type N-terminal cleavage/methylation domain-containing protein/prepilin-type processing-associated H-X9-DG protein
MAEGSGRLKGRLQHLRFGMYVFSSGQKRQAFTLLELLVVIAVIAILLCTFMPALSGVKAKSNATKCLSNLKQLGYATEMYADDHGEHFPGDEHSSPSWLAALAPYSGTNVYRCPCENKRPHTYMINDFLTPHPADPDHRDFSLRTSIPAPSETFWMSESPPAARDLDHFHFAHSRYGGYTRRAFEYKVDVARHGGAANYLFVDSHVELLKWSKVARKLEEVGSNFVNPEGNVATSSRQASQ